MEQVGCASAPEVCGVFIRREGVRLVRSVVLTLIWLCYCGSFLTLTAASDPLRLTIMVGFIKDPQHSYSIDEWRPGLGSSFDAQALVSSVKKAGASEIIFYDKWIDGLVFHDTKTTSFKTEKDFLAELAPECKRQGIRLVIYFNAFTDGNPEFRKWACTDQRGEPISFSTRWDCAFQTPFSPFREKVFAQLREIIENYDVDGLWLDAPRMPQACFDRWFVEAFRNKMGKPVEESSPAKRFQFNVDATSDWIRELAAYIRKLKAGLTVTSNSNPFFDPRLAGPRHFLRKGELLDYLSAELHDPRSMEPVAPVLGDYSIPAEGGILVSGSWFTPIDGPAPRSGRSPGQLQQEVAQLFGAGVNAYLAITLGRDGTPDEATVEQLAVAGNWLKTRRPYIEGGERIADVAIVMGTADVTDYDWPGQAEGSDTYDPGWLGAGNANDCDVYGLERRLRESGYLTRRLTNAGKMQRWDSVPAGVRALIVPDRASLSAEDRDRVRHFVSGGGKILAFPPRRRSRREQRHLHRGSHVRVGSVRRIRTGRSPWRARCLEHRTGYRRPPGFLRARIGPD